MSLGSSQVAIGDNEEPLIKMALRNSLRFAATGEVMRNWTKAAPVPWPTNVTISGLPPNAPTFSCSQCKAALWSKRPKLLPTFCSRPGLRKPEINEKIFDFSARITMFLLIASSTFTFIICKIQLCAAAAAKSLKQILQLCSASLCCCFRNLAARCDICQQRSWQK